MNPFGDAMRRYSAVHVPGFSHAKVAKVFFSALPVAALAAFA